MDHLAYPIGPSAQIPLREGYRLRFASALKDRKSPWAVTTMFPGFASELKDLPKTRDIKLEATIDLLSRMGGPSTPGDIWDVFHSIPRDLLGSLILGTVGFDSCRAQNKVTGLSDDGPGIYVIGLSISGRGGKVLNATELDILIQNLKTYMRGYRYWADGVQTQRATNVARFIAEVDSAYGALVTPARPRFISDDGNLEACNHLLSSLIRRRNRLVALDPTGTEYMIQSPQYVGCSIAVQTRTTAYELRHTRSALTNANKFYALTVSLLRAQQLVPKVHIRTAVRTWTDKQLPDAEKLVAVLAGAYVSQDGFNLRDAGGNPGPPLPGGSTWMSQEEYVFAEVPHTTDNVSRSLEDLERLKKFRAHETVLAPLDNGSLQQAMDQCIESTARLKGKAKMVQQKSDDVDTACVQDIGGTSCGFA